MHGVQCFSAQSMVYGLYRSFYVDIAYIDVVYIDLDFVDLPVQYY